MPEMKKYAEVVAKSVGQLLIAAAGGQNAGFRQGANCLLTKRRRFLCVADLDGACAMT